MRIGIDGKPLAIPHPCGLQTYTINLLEQLAKIDKKNIYIVFATGHVKIPKQHNFTLHIVQSWLPWQLSLPWHVHKERLDLFHVLRQHGPVFISHPRMITTIHDLVPQSSYPRLFTSFYYEFISWYTQLICRITLKKSHTLLAVSNFTRDEIQRAIGAKKHIYVVHEGVSSTFHRVTKKEGKNEFFLAMADFSLRKNIVRTLRAYAQLPFYIRSRYKLRIILSMDFPKKSILASARSLGVDDLVLVQQPSLIDLVTLYNEAVAFIYPSLYEGFGLPILEAMACGCPVITSDRTATKEIAGHAASLVNPESVEEISNAMKILAVDKRMRNNIIQKGLIQVKLFSWETTAKKTLEIYEKTLKT